MAEEAKRWMKKKNGNQGTLKLKFELILFHYLVIGSLLQIGNRKVIDSWGKNVVQSNQSRAFFVACPFR